MVRKIAICIFIITFYYNCNNNSSPENEVGVKSPLTGNEDRGIKEIIAGYGGLCEYGREKTISIGKSTQMNFWIKLSQSPVMDSLAGVVGLPGSNIAYIFYKNLEKEKNLYSNIQTELVFSDGGNAKFSYTQQQLETVKVKMQFVNKIVDLIKSQNFNAITDYLNVDSALIGYNKEQLIAAIEENERNFGRVKEFVPYGFQFSKSPKGLGTLHIAGVVVHDKKKGNYFSIYLNEGFYKNEIYNINYKL